jgi:tetratricopeptide (TPR) repeat protein
MITTAGIAFDGKLIMKWSGLISGMLVLGGGRLVAHPDPSHTIEAITAQIDAGDRRAPLYYSRGVEFRALGKLVEAERDFRSALEGDAAFLPARKDLAAVLLEQNKLDEAGQAANEAIRISAGKPAPSQASSWIVLARIELARGHFQGVLDATGQALRLVPRGELDWFLLRADAWRGLSRLDDAIADLKAGYDSLKSSVLRTAWLDALIDAGRGREALPVIEAEMAECRYKASWLIRRARVRLAGAETDAARNDLRAALGELELHIFPQEPDPMLLIERGMALALLGEKEKAARELEKVKEITTEPEVIAPLAKLIEPPAEPR